MHITASKNRQKGQVLLLVVLASVIALTVGLAAISRTVTNTRVSTEESNSQKALASAEAGIEEQINRIKAGNTTPFTEGNFTTEVNPVIGREFALNDGAIVSQDDGADIWLSDHKDWSAPVLDTRLTIRWKKNNADCMKDPAIEVVAIHGNINSPNMSRFVFDACATRRIQNSFSTATGPSRTYNGETYDYYGIVDVSGRGYIARVIPLYADAYVMVDSTQSLPSQGYTIYSQGNSGDTVRKLRVFQGHQKLPIEFFPYNLFLPS